MAITSFRPDVSIIRLALGAIGVVEVKRPDAVVEKMTDPNAHRQLATYMIRSMYGVQHVFGILATYEKWRICWLPDTDEAAKSDTLLTAEADPTTFTSDGTRICMSQVYALDFKEPSNCTPMTRSDGKPQPRHIVHVLASVLKRMANSRVSAPAALVGSIGTGVRFHPLANSKDIRFVRLPALKSVSLEPPPETVNEFVLLQDYGAGRDGRVWLACSEQGNLAVLKFGLPRKDSTLEDGAKEARKSLEAECDRWRLLLGRERARYVRVTTLLGKPVLAMPFAFHGPNFREPDHLERPNCVREFELVRAQLEACRSTPIELLRLALEQLRRVGIVYTDVEWRHVALLPKLVGSTWVLEPIMIDLTVERVEPEDEEQMDEEQKRDEEQPAQPEQRVQPEEPAQPLQLSSGVNSMATSSIDELVALLQPLLNEAREKDKAAQLHYRRLGFPRSKSKSASPSAAARPTPSRPSTRRSPSAACASSSSSTTSSPSQSSNQPGQPQSRPRTRSVAAKETPASRS